MKDRRAVPRFPLSVPATIYDGQTEIHCMTRDISVLGVAVCGISGGLPARTLRVRLTVSEDAPPVLCDCFPVAQHPVLADTWGLRFLHAPGDLPVGLESLATLGELALAKPAKSKQAAGGASRMVDSSREPVESDPKDFDRELQELFVEALHALE